MDEIYIKVKGVWKYLCRAFDKQRKTGDFLLTANRDMTAGKRFFDNAMGANGELDQVAMDKQVVGTVAAIDAASKKIVDIISVIDGIAFQTNILALNAAVEVA